MASPVTIQPSTADTYIREGFPTTVSGTLTYMQVDATASSRARCLESFDFHTNVPAGATITVATLSLYRTGGTAGRTITVHRLLRTDWAEAQATWNIFKTGSSWGTVGALNATTDFTATDAATAAAASGWMSWDVLNQVKTAFAAVGGIAHFLVADAGASAGAYQTFNTRYASNTTLRPKLYIEYTVPVAGPAALKTVNGLAKASVQTRNGLAIASIKTWNGLA